MNWKKLLLAVATITALALPVVASAARTDALWDYIQGGNYTQPNGSANGTNLLIYGINHYINFGTLTGVNGYGIRDNAGTIECKNSGGSWAACAGGGGGGGTVTSVFTRTGDVVAQSGDYTTAQVTESGNLYYTFARGLADFITNLAATSSVKSIVTLPSLSLPYSQLTGTPVIASTTLLGDSNTFSGTINKFSNAPALAISGLIKGNGSSAITAGANGTDFTLITAKTCNAGDFILSTTAAGVFNCGTPAGTTYTATYPVIVTGSVISSGFGTTSNNGIGANVSLYNNANGVMVGVATSSSSFSIGGNAGTATALAANGTNCSAGNYPLGVDASGNSESCTAAGTGTVTSVTATNPIFSTGGTTPVISTLFSTTTTFGLGNNGFLITGATGIAFVAASSTLNLPNTALTNSSLTVNTSGGITGGGAVSLGGTLNLTIGSNALTLSQFPTIAANTVIGNLTGSTATPTAFATSSIFTGSAGQIAYFSGSGALIGTSTIFTTTASFVGIGTTTPDKIFHVQGAQAGGIMRVERVVAAASATKYGTYDIALKDTLGGADFMGPAQTFSYRNTAGTLTTLADITAYRNGADNTGSLAFSSYTTGTPFEVMRLNNNTSGLVGIATTTPRGQLNISNNTNALFPQLVLTDTNAGTNLHMLYASTTAGALTFGKMSDAYSLTELMRLTSAGFLGIGTTSPYKTLSVGGDVVVGAPTAGGTNGNLFLNQLATPAGTFLAVDPTGKVIATTTPSGTLATPVSIANGGTNVGSQTTNGVNYFDGTKITSGTNVSYDGTTLQVTGSGTNNTLKVIGTSAVSSGLYFQNTQTTGQAVVYVDNDRGSFASYGGLLDGSSVNSIGNLFGVSRADHVFLFADGASNNGLTVGTLNATALTFGTNNTEVSRYDSSGRYGFGSTTPWSYFSVNKSNITDYTRPLFSIATSTDASGQLFHVFATSTSLISTFTSIAKNIFDSGTRVIIGALTQYDAAKGVFDQLFVNGRINTGDWRYIECLGAVGGLSNGGTSDTGSVCPYFAFENDSGGGWSLDASGGIFQYILKTNNGLGQVITVANNGTGLFMDPVNLAVSGLPLLLATTTPVTEVVARIDTPANATSTNYYIGFSNVSPGGSTFELEPTAGCYFVASSTLTNWQAQCRTSLANTTTVDTNIASSSNITATGSFYRFRIEADGSTARFYIGTPTSAFAQVASINTNYPGTTALGFGVWQGNTGAGLQKIFDINSIKLWYFQPAIRY